MSDNQPFPVKFHAALALEKILRKDVAIEFVKPGLNLLVQCYLSLMNEIDNEELTNAFENITIIF